jgi:hypothetical protein
VRSGTARAGVKRLGYVAFIALIADWMTLPSRTGDGCACMTRCAATAAGIMRNVAFDVGRGHFSCDFYSARASRFNIQLIDLSSVIKATMHMKMLQCAKTCHLTISELRSHALPHWGYASCGNSISGHWRLRSAASTGNANRRVAVVLRRARSRRHVRRNKICGVGNEEEHFGYRHLRRAVRAGHVVERSKRARRPR